MDGKKHTKKTEKKSPLIAFFAAIAAFPTRFAGWLASCWLGRAFLSYDTVTEGFRESRLFRRFRDMRGVRALSPVRDRVARALSDGKPTVLLRSFLEKLRYTETRTYGVMFATLGLYTVLAYAFKRYLIAGDPGDFSALVTGIVIVLISLLMLLSGKPLGHDLQESRLLGFLFFHVVNMRRSPLIPGRVKPFGAATAFLVGSLLGISSFIWHPLYTVGAILGIALFSLLLFSPELCLFSAVFLAPFMIFAERPTILLCVLILIGVVGYCIKLLFGKRLLSFEPLDFAVLFLMAAYLFSVFFTYGGTPSVARALVYTTLLCGYFLAVNLLTSSALIKQAVSALVFGGSVVVVIGLFQQFAGKAVADWLDSSAYEYISGRITSLFENPNVLAVYLILLFPFVMAGILSRGSSLQRTGRFLLFCMFLAAIVYTWSRGAWLGVLCALAVFLFACNPATMYLLIPACVAAPFLLHIAGGPIALRLSSITSADTSVSYRLNLWRGTWRMLSDHFLGGIGMGEEAFLSVYPYYALSGIETAPHTHSLYLQHFAEFGFMGMVLLLVFIFLFFCCNFTHIRSEKNDGLRLTSLAAGCGVVAVLMNGFFDQVFYNSRVFFLFFIVVGIASACSRVGKTEEIRRAPIRDDGSETFSVDIAYS